MVSIKPFTMIKIHYPLDSTIQLSQNWPNYLPSHIWIGNNFCIVTTDQETNNDAIQFSSNLAKKKCQGIS